MDENIYMLIFSGILLIQIIRRLILLSVLFCWHLKDYCGQLTLSFYILRIMCGGRFTAVTEIDLFQ